MTNRTLIIALTLFSLIVLACAGGGSNTPAERSATNLDETPMPGGEFMRFQEELAAEELPANRLYRIDQIAQTNHFLASQIRDIVKHFDHTDDRLRALELTSDKLIDLDNTYSTIVYNFPEDERAQAQAILNATGAERESIIAERERQEAAEREARRARQQAALQEQMERQQQRQQNQQAGSDQSAGGGGGGGGSSSQTCCLNGQFFECPSAAAVAKCVPPQFVSCVSQTMDVMSCADEYPPDPSDCDRTPARDSEC